MHAGLSSKAIPGSPPHITLIAILALISNIKSVVKVIGVIVTARIIPATPTLIVVIQVWEFGFTRKMPPLISPLGYECGNFKVVQICPLPV